MINSEICLKRFLFNRALKCFLSIRGVFFFRYCHLWLLFEKSWINCYITGALLICANWCYWASHMTAQTLSSSLLDLSFIISDFVVRTPIMKTVKSKQKRKIGVW